MKRKQLLILALGVMGLAGVEGMAQTVNGDHVSAEVLERAANRVKQMHVLAQIDESLKGIKTVNLNAGFAKVDVEQTGKADAAGHIEGSIESMEQQDYFVIDYKADGDVAQINVSVPETAQSYAGAFKLQVAEGMNVNITTKNGAVKVNKVKADKVSVTTVGGKVTVSKTTADVSVTTKAGVITCEKLNGNVTVKSGSAPVTVSECEGTITAETGEGTLTANKNRGTLSTATLAGKQSIDDFEGPELAINVKSGEVRLQHVKVDQMNIKGTRSDIKILTNIECAMKADIGAGSLVSTQLVKLTGSSEFESSTGRVKLRLMNKKEELTFDLTSDSKEGAMNAKGQSKKKKLQFGNGPIVVKSHSVSGDQMFN